MIVISDPREFNLSGSAVSIGMFDGVHRGHRRVLRKLRERGLALQLPTVLVTFDHHPLATLRPASCPALLSTLEGRADLLASTGHVDYCLVLKFDQERSTESADDFVRRTLVSMLGMRSLIVGENFACGSGRQGNIEYLDNLGGYLGFDVRPVPLRPPNACIENGAHCSSSETRRLIQLGDITSANAMLNRPHELPGTVFGPSDSACRVIDVAVPRDMCSPPVGDYAGTVKRQDVAAPWIGAILQVREQHSRIGARTVRLLVERDTEIALGEAMTVRFLDRARSAASRVAFGAMVLI
ncbi:FAD synthetase family protein [Paraburkholderia sp. BL10I2N1]|uniref:FAD synthetase family protein n=1 Tax=Paraburkholderia sp. BL10I2N1 TaxID=1938796 RepID=UPI00105C740B|nr:FAD synthetase family protein [Paraburkholderia sp. BL10I2N1]TDN61915.1 riboflavin kinase/FMN adenylyltransferase [Paraburkholderia sp. BL10I2N1]